MYIFYWLINIILFLFLLSFSAKNTEVVTVNYYFDIEWQAPIIVILLIFFVLGIGFGYLSTFTKKAQKNNNDNNII